MKIFNSSVITSTLFISALTLQSLPAHAMAGKIPMSIFKKAALAGGFSCGVTYAGKILFKEPRFSNTMPAGGFFKISGSVTSVGSYEGYKGYEITGSLAVNVPTTISSRKEFDDDLINPSMGRLG
jgi:hypothetical protein